MLNKHRPTTGDSYNSSSQDDKYDQSNRHPTSSSALIVGMMWDLLRQRREDQECSGPCTLALTKAYTQTSLYSDQMAKPATDDSALSYKSPSKELLHQQCRAIELIPPCSTFLNSPQAMADMVKMDLCRPMMTLMKLK